MNRKKEATSLFAFLKAADNQERSLAQAVPVSGSSAVLIPISKLHMEAETPEHPSLARRLDSLQRSRPNSSTTNEGIGDEASQWLKQGYASAVCLDFLLLNETYELSAIVRAAVSANDPRVVQLSMPWESITLGNRDVIGGALATLSQWLRRNLFCGVELGPEVSRRVANPERHGFTPAEGRYSYHPPIAQPCSAHPILTAGPNISPREEVYAADAVRNGWNRQWSGYLDRFQTTFAEMLGRKYALATSSCTGALHLSLLALGVGPGDEVIVPELTWVATASVVRYVGAEPVFVDVQEDSWCMSPAALEAAITERTKAVIPVHLYGHPAAMDRICDIASHHGIHVIEDAAAAFGALVQGRKAGTFGDSACFSFQGAKVLVTGEGGMFTTDDDSLFRRVRGLWDHGRDPDRVFWIKDVGLKYKMANVQAAVGLGQLERADLQIARKREIFELYEQRLSEIPHTRLHKEAPWAQSGYWMTSLRLLPQHPSANARDQVIALLRERGVDTRPAFPAISSYPMWNTIPTNKTARSIGNCSINLPSGVNLTAEEIHYVCDVIHEILESPKSVAEIARRQASA